MNIAVYLDINTLWPNDAIWCQRSRSISTQVMAEPMLTDHQRGLLVFSISQEMLKIYLYIYLTLVRKLLIQDYVIIFQGPMS